MAAILDPRSSILATTILSDSVRRSSILFVLEHLSATQNLFYREGGRVIIDIHGHIDRLADRQLDADEVEAYAHASGVGLILVSNRDAGSKDAGGIDLDETEANAACLAACESCPVLKPLYWVRLGKYDSNVHAFTGALSSAPFLGAVFSPLENEFDVRSQELLAPYLTTLGNLGLPALFCVYTDERAAIGEVISLARRHTNVPFVLYDAAQERNWSKLADDIYKSIHRSDAQLYLDTAGASLAQVREAIQILGPQQVLYGSGGTILNDADVQAGRTLLDGLRAELPPTEFEQIATGNARQLFNLHTQR